MKRLLAQIGLSYFSVLAVVFYFQRTVTGWIAAGLAMLLLAFFFIRRIRRTIFVPAMTAAALVACLVSIGYSVFAIEPLQQRYCDEDRLVVAQLSDESYYSDSVWYYPLQVSSVNGDKASFRLMLTSYDDLHAEPFDTVSFFADLSPDVSDAYRAKGYYIYIDAYDTPAVTAAYEYPLYYRAIEIRRTFRSVIGELLPADDAALVDALLLGDRYALSPATKSDFRRAGASHFVVVSGMHFAILVSIVMGLLRRLRLSRYLYIPLTVGFILLYMAVTGFSPSVMRSGIMMIFYILGLLIPRIHYGPNSLGMACVLMTVLLSPSCAGDIGLLLSVYATLAILLWADPIYRRLRVPRFRPHRLWWLLDKGIALFATALAANLLVFPISLFSFGAFSTVGLVSAVLLYLEIWLILVIALPMCLLYLIPGIRLIAVGLSWAVYALCEVVLFLVRGLSALPFAYVKVTYPFLYVWLIMTAVLVATALLLLRGYGVRYAALLSAAILLSGVLSCAVVQDTKRSLTVYSAGSGICVNLYDRGGTYLLAMDATVSESYRMRRDVESSAQFADVALSGSLSETRNYRLLLEEAFAISDILQYDEDKTEIPCARTFCDAVEVIPDDELRMLVCPVDGMPVRWIEAGDNDILILPDGIDAAALSTDLRSPDILITGDIPENYRLLSCDTLIFCGSDRLSKAALSSLSAIYTRAVLTDEDVCLSLR